MRHFKEFTTYGDVFKQYTILKGRVKIVIKYSDADECPN
jgi:hypothetical protein